MTSIDVEVRPARNEKGLIAPGVPSVEDFRNRVPEVADSIREIAEAIQTKLDAGDQAQLSAARWMMDSAQLTFQMGLEAGAGVIIAKASASATFSIQITWKRSG
jgi:Trypsin-co-occurring domain 1